jgi:arylsulfatase A-like enzyme
MQGRSLVPVLKGETPEDWRDAHYYHYYEHPSEHVVQRHYGITTQEYKLIHFYYEMDTWELYDIKKDPQEMNNVYGSPEYAKVQAQLHQELEALRSQYGDSDALNQQFIAEYQEKVKANPYIEYWKFPREELMKIFGMQSEEKEESNE